MICNEERADRAERGVGLLGEIYPPTETDTVVVDFLADLMHSMGKDAVADAVRLAGIHFEEEEDADAEEEGGAA
jgi:hypothetical protein